MFIKIFLISYIFYWSIYISKARQYNLGVIIFDLVFIKKIIKLNIFFKKPKPVQTNRFRLCFQDKNRFGSVFSVWLGFFYVWLGFFDLARFWLSFFSDWVRFGFFSFRLIKPNRSVFFLILIGFFSRFGFFNYFFSGFLSLIGFSVFFSPQYNLTKYYFTIINIYKHNIIISYQILFLFYIISNITYHSTTVNTFEK